MEVLQATSGVFIRYGPLCRVLGVLFGYIGYRSGAQDRKKKTHSDVEIKYTVAVVHGNDVIASEPRRKPRREDVEGEKVATQKEDKLKHVETEKGIPEPTSDCVPWLADRDLKRID